jgi:hypothetical protein
MLERASIPIQSILSHKYNISPHIFVHIYLKDLPEDVFSSRKRIGVHCSPKLGIRETICVCSCNIIFKCIAARLMLNYKQYIVTYLANKLISCTGPYRRKSNCLFSYRLFLSPVLMIHMCKRLLSLYLEAS